MLFEVIAKMLGLGKEFTFKQLKSKEPRKHGIHLHDWCVVENLVSGEIRLHTVHVNLSHILGLVLSRNGSVFLFFDAYNFISLHFLNCDFVVEP